MRGRVYVVEDVPDDREMLTHVLRALGYETVFPSDPDASVAAAAQLSPSLIVLCADVKNGFNLCLRFKKDPVLKTVPLLLTTERANPEVIRKHGKLPTRADSYLRKPFTVDALREALAALLPEDLRVTDLEEVQPVGEFSDHTVVTRDAMDSAVLTYVDEEVRVLKDVVSRLQNEKADLSGKLSDVEQRLRSQNEILDSGLKSLREMRSEPRPDEIELARKEGNEQGRREGRDEARDEARKQIADLEARLAEAEADRAAARSAAAAADRVPALEAEVAALREAERAARLEVDQNLEMFERLEAGYKESLEALAAEKTRSDEALATAEAEADGLRDQATALVGQVAALQGQVASLEGQVAALEGQVAGIPALREAAARADSLDGEVQSLRGQVVQLTAELDAQAPLRDRVQALETRTAELEVTNAAMASELVQVQGVRKELEKARAAEAEAVAETVRLQERLTRLKSLLADDGGSP